MLAGLGTLCLIAASADLLPAVAKAPHPGEDKLSAAIGTRRGAPFWDVPPGIVGTPQPV